MRAGTARLDCLNLGLSPCQSSEAIGKLITVEEKAFAGLYRAESRAGRAADTAGRELVGLVQRSMLLGLLAVGCEGVGEGVGWGGWVGLRCVVDS